MLSRRQPSRLTLKESVSGVQYIGISVSLEVLKKFVIHQLGMALVEVVPSEGKGGLDNPCRLLPKRCAPKKRLFKGLFFGGLPQDTVKNS